jgi:DHA1 family bicyclomycin/chloramphenicol resistance-like MFS transporter
MQVLIIARFLQALGCCSTVNVARAMVRDAWLPEHSVRVIARASTWLALAPLLGPVLGAWLQVALGWRAAFAALTIFSCGLLLITLLRLPETNEYKNPRATNLSGLLANYRLVLGSREFWAYALPGALSYGAIFAFISGVSFVLIQILDVPTAWFGLCYALGVAGYMTGTIVCRRLLPRLGTARAFQVGGMAAMGAGMFFLAAVAAGIAHWSIVVVAMFLVMGAHGINFPIAQSGSVTPFAQQAGTAAGLMGALAMAVAFAVGSVVGATHNGTLYPLAIIACVMGLLIFCSIRTLPSAVAEAA